MICATVCYMLISWATNADGLPALPVNMTRYPSVAACRTAERAERAKPKRGAVCRALVK